MANASYRCIVAGTGFEGRAARIKAFARPDMPVFLKPEPDNPHDANAIAVFIQVRAWYTFFRRTNLQIGYIKRDKAAFFSRKLKEGGNIRGAYIVSMFTDQDHPRVSIEIEATW